MEQKSQKLLNTLREYYSIQNRFAIMENIINANPESNHVSLRLVDWLITNYSKSKNVVYYVKGAPFNVHQSYKNMLKAYSKRLFDPFRRHGRIILEHNGQRLETTVAQLSFFRWAIDNDVLKYASEHRDAIKKNMDLHTKNRNPDKRSELSKSSKGANVYSVNICVSFT